MSTTLPTALLALAAVAAAGGAAAGPHQTGPDNAPCFLLRQWQGVTWPNEHTLYLGVNYKQVYEVTLDSNYRQLNDPLARVIFRTSAPSSICSARDLQLDVRVPPNIQEGLVATSMVKLTPEQVKAIPPKYIPNW
ncbi:MAG: hypothetical protein JO111_03835 [Caulobacteraceae bacterium]|nr:hypothetical protein [Caulobacteraceae bacterium]